MKRSRKALLGVTLLVCAFALAGTQGCGGCTPESTPQPEEEPAALWPLTGEEAPDEAALRERVVSVKIENLPAARPQTGLSAADVVYESLTEGGITRFNAIFHSELPDTVGPVRSARFSDIYIVPQYRALFAYSGANRLVLERIRSEGLEDVGANEAPDLYERTERPAPHNLYLDLPGVREVAEEMGFETQADPPQLVFGEAPSTESSATAVTVPFRSENRVTWTWNEESGRYERAINDEPHVGTESDEPIAASNVIVMFAEESGGERAGTLDIRLTGSGDGLVLRDGLLYEVTWTAEDDSPPTFSTADGTEVPLAVGRTWIEIVPVGLQVTTE